MHPQRVHIVPFRRKRDRVVDPLLANRADRVYLLPAARVSTATCSEIEADLSTAGIAVETYPVDHLDMYAVFGLVTTLASRPEHADDHVFVNVSTGSRLAAIGAALGCMDVSTEATPYYVPDETTAEARSAGNERAVETYPIDSPTRSQVAMLAVVAVEDDDLSSPTKRRLIDRAIDLELALETPIAFGTNLVEMASNIDRGQARAGFDDLTANEKKSAYRTLDSMVLGRLVEAGHVRVVSAGRSDQVELTERGENTLRAFRHKITDVLRELDGRAMPAWLQEGLDDGK